MRDLADFSRNSNILTILESPPESQAETGLSLQAGFISFRLLKPAIELQ
jgi:hypothetical protein